MSSRETLHFSDISYSEEDKMRHTKGGCHVSIPMGFILTLLAVLIAVGVGIIVHFAGPGRQVVCNCQFNPSNGQGTSGKQVQWEECKKLASEMGKDISCLEQMSTTSSGPEITSTTARPTVSGVRLPDTVKPIHYDVELKPDLYGSDPTKFRFSGKVKAYLECKKSTDQFKLHINKLDIVNDTIRFGAADDGSSPQFTHWVHDKENQFFVAHLDGNMTLNHRYFIEIEFSGPLTNDLTGLYRSEYKRGNDTVYIATTQFQPTDARKAFPCMDEPALKATFNITLMRKAPFKSLSSMRIISTNGRGDGWLSDVYETTPIMPTYLLAFVVCDFKYTEDRTLNGTVFRVWSRPEAINQTAYAISIGSRILRHFERYFDIPFPLPKTDMIAIPDFAAGAMENWGLITYRETALLYDPGVSSSSNKQRVAVVVAHELAHQWFGNLVTPDWWDDLWLNEGFASYVEYIGTDYVEPGMQMMDQFITEDLQDVMVIDSLSTSHPIYVPVNHPDEINEIFDRISYAKGASVIRMMNFFLGESTFTKGVTNYLRNNSYANAFHLELFESLTRAATEDGLSVDVVDVMNTWIKQMGYPLITIERNYGAGTASVTQAHFLIDPTQPVSTKYPSPYSYKWEVPLTMTTNATQPVAWNKTSADVIWMHKVNIDLMGSHGVPSSANDWIIANTMEYGYYRVNYDQTNWKLIQNQLVTNHMAIHVRNRAQIIDDAFNLARAGTIETTEALSISKYISDERALLPWSAYTGNIGYIDSMLARTPVYGDFEEYMLEQVTSLYDYVGWNASISDGHLFKRLRYIAIARACKYDHKPCLEKASELYGQWMLTPNTNPIDVELKTTVYCYGIRNGGVKEWDFAYEKYKESNVATEKSKLLYAMSCAKTPWILNRYLLRALNQNEIRKQDAVSVISNVANNAIGEPLAWDFVRAYWDTLMTSYGGGSFSFSNLLSGITSDFNTEFELQELKEFKQKHPNLGSGQRAFDQAMEKTAANIKWLGANQEKIASWLQSR